MAKLTKEQKIEMQMRLFHLTREEATKVVEDDEIIDRGGVCDWEQPLTKEQKANMRKARSADRTIAKKRTPRAKLVNNDKMELINTISANLCDNGASNMEFINREREITFDFNGVKYKIVLSVPRT